MPAAAAARDCDSWECCTSLQRFIKTKKHRVFLSGAEHSTKKNHAGDLKITSQFTSCNSPNRIDSLFRERKQPQAMISHIRTRKGGPYHFGQTGNCYSWKCL